MFFIRTSLLPRARCEFNCDRDFKRFLILKTKLFKYMKNVLFLYKSFFDIAFPIYNRTFDSSSSLFLVLSFENPLKRAAFHIT